MNRPLIRAAVLLCCSALAGCYTVRFYHGKKDPDRARVTSFWHHTFINGIVEPGGAIRVDDECPAGAQSIRNEVGFLNGLGTFASQAAISTPTYYWGSQETTLGPGSTAFYLSSLIRPWNPSTVEITCAAPSGSGTSPSTPANPESESHGAAFKSAPKPLKIAVLKLAVAGGIDQSLANLLTDGMVGELRKYSNLTVMGDADVAAVIGFERQKQLLGCSEGSCLAEIGGALGVDRVIHGSLGKVGTSLLVNLSSIDAAKGRVVASVSERFKGENEEAFLDALPRLVYQLLQEPAQVGAPVTH